MRLIKHKLYATENAIKLKSYCFGIRYASQSIIKQCICDKNKKTKDVLIVKVDSIGDYVLIRNFWRELKKCEKYKDAKITLILSSAMKGIAEFLDSDIIEKFLYVPHPFWKTNDNEKFYILKALFENGLKKQYDTILFPSFNVSNVQSFNVMLASSIASKESIAQIGDSNPNDWNTMSSNQFFTQIVTNLNGKNQFELLNNKIFFEHACEQKINIDMHHIDIKKTGRSDYVVINPGSQDKMRNWHAQNYANIAKYLVNRYHLKIVLVGSNAEKEICSHINSMTQGGCEIIVGSSFEKLLELMNNAALFIGNDSSCFHIAVSLKTKAICISGGVSWHRFVNYPTSNLYRIVIDNGTRELLENFTNDPKNKYKCCPFVGNVNSVTYSQVKNEIDALMSSGTC